MAGDASLTELQQAKERARQALWAAEYALLLEQGKHPDWRLADALHLSECRYNHTDQCGYDYELWETPGELKTALLYRAQALIAPLRVAFDELVCSKVIEAMITLVTNDGEEVADAEGS